MVTGILVPHNITIEMQRIELTALADYQAAVGGYIEIIHVQRHPLVIVADEEGKLKRLPSNRRATCLWWLLDPDGLGGDVLVGDVVILGPEKHGESTSAPMNLISLLLETSRYQVEVCLSPEHGTWAPIGDTVGDFFEATIRALTLMEVWNPPHEVKVVAAE